MKWTHAKYFENFQDLQIFKEFIHVAIKMLTWPRCADFIPEKVKITSLFSKNIEGDLKTIHCCRFASIVPEIRNIPEKLHVSNMTIKLGLVTGRILRLPLRPNFTGMKIVDNLRHFRKEWTMLFHACVRVRFYQSYFINNISLN